MMPRYRLRTLLIFVTIAGVVFRYLALVLVQGSSFGGVAGGLLAASVFSRHCRV